MVRALVPLSSAYQAQLNALIGWLAALPAESFDAPSVLTGWDVRTLVGHLLLIHRGLGEQLGVQVDEPPTPLADFVRRYQPAVESITEQTLLATGDSSPGELIDALRAVPDIAEPLAFVSPNTVIRAARGPIAAADWVATRLIELVVHSDDLRRSLPDVAPVPIDRAALATVTRLLAEILATQASGRSVEVRVAPFVAVQAVEGPRHTRGTPPNVVEMAPLIWIRVATGRLAWAEAVSRGDIRASGQRADLTPYLPVLS